MKINGSYPRDIGSIYKNHQNSSRSEKRTAKNILQKDKLQLSAEAQKFKELTKKAAALPEVRAEKVAQIKAKITSGTYYVPAEKLASKMLAEK